MRPFWVLHRDLPREGPGEAADVAWAADVAGVAHNARIADIACGPGADIAALLDAAPQGRLTAIDKTAHFLEDVRARFGEDPRVAVQQGDMGAVTGQYDFIWCAGAAYIVGVDVALNAWREVLANGGHVAFSEPCLFDGATDEAVAFWDGYDVQDAQGIARVVTGAGFETVATRKVSDAAWEAYYQPKAARIAKLRPEADTELAEVLDEAADEIAKWRRLKDQTGYLLSVVRPCP